MADLTLRVWGFQLEHLLTVTHQTRSTRTKKKQSCASLVGLCCNVVAFLSLPLLSHFHPIRYYSVCMCEVGRSRCAGLSLFFCCCFVLLLLTCSEYHARVTRRERMNEYPRQHTPGSHVTHEDVLRLRVQCSPFVATSIDWR